MTNPNPPAPGTWAAMGLWFVLGVWPWLAMAILPVLHSLLR